MYFTYGWPKILRNTEADPQSAVSQIASNRDRIIFALLTNSTLSIWTSKPCLPVVSHQRSQKSVEKLGTNVKLTWKQDSTAIVVVTSGGYLLFYGLGNGDKNLYEQTDSQNPKLRRESDELFLKEPIPSITIQLLLEVAVRGQVIGSVSCFRDELMVSTDENSILRYRWDGTLNNDFCIDLRRIPFSMDQQASRAVPLQDRSSYPVDFHYSPVIGGFSLVMSDGRAAFLTASTKVYDPNSVQGIWAPGIDDACCSCVNHKYRLLSFGRKNSQTAVMVVDEQTGGLQHLFSLRLSSKDFPGSPGPVRFMAWTPDGCAIAVCWERGGFALWSVFGSLLTCSWQWSADLSPFAQRVIKSFDWSAEGYQLWIAVDSNATACQEYVSNSMYNAEKSGSQDGDGDSPSSSKSRNTSQSSIPESSLPEHSRGGVFCVMSFVKSALTVNPGMSQIEHLYLQGEDRILVNFTSEAGQGSRNKNTGNTSNKTVKTVARPAEILAPLGNNKNWVVIPIPNTYLGTNWPIRFTAMDAGGEHLAVSGRYGLAHYSIADRKWKLFGNEAQEHDFVVVGGMMWWDNFLVVAVYDIAQDRDELRFYPLDAKLDNRFAYIKRLPSQILLLSLDRDKLLTYAADSTLAIFQLKTDLKSFNANPTTVDPCECLQTIDVGALCAHPACVISVYLTTLKTSFSSNASSQQHSVVINVSGRLMILHHEYLVQDPANGNAPQYITPTVLASCVEMVWLPRASYHSQTGPNYNLYLSEALWLYCGQEMRVWLPLREKSQSSIHTFIANRIMLGFPISVYPLTIMFDKAIILGAENDSLSYTTNPSSTPDASSPSSIFPFCTVQRTSQVYLHQILRQLICRNLGYYAWEIARSCTKLPYFPHSLELLLHEVLEEEATSKEPIPDALLPSVIEFVREFPVYLRTVGQCARKTELALWPHLFSVAGRPRALFDECLQRGQLDIAATYLLVIQNLESPTVSRKFATQLMDKALENKKLDLVRDLVRFLKAIDPSEVDVMRTSVPKFNTQTPPVSPTEYDISMVLGTMQVPRMRSLSTSVVPKFPELTTKDQKGAELRGHPSVSPSGPQSGNTPVGNSAIYPGSQMSPGGGASGSPNAYQNTNPYGEPPSPGPTVVGYNPYSQELGSAGDKASLSAAYVDAIIERHAGKILSEGKLRDLGILAAHLDFHLVTWLKKEKRRRPVMVTDFVAALKMIHSEFEWPYPEYSSVVSQHSRTPSTDSIKFQTPEASSPMKPISVDTLANRLAHSAILSGNGNDSGYNSTPGNHFDIRDGQNVVEARLMPAASGLPDDTLSILSEESVMTDQSPLTPQDFIPALHQLPDTPKTSALHSSKRGVELRFLQQIMSEAGILDWSLLIAIVLRDALGVIRTVNASRDQSVETLRNLRDGLLSLALWATTQCMGYKAFITTINNQVNSILSKYLASAQIVQNHSLNSANNVATGGGAHGELNRRKTEPALMGSKPRTQTSPKDAAAVAAQQMPRAANFENGIADTSSESSAATTVLKQSREAGRNSREESNSNTDPKQPASQAKQTTEADEDAENEGGCVIT